VTRIADHINPPLADGLPNFLEDSSAAAQIDNSSLTLLEELKGSLATQVDNVVDAPYGP
jgi:hypothetical protein